MKKTIKVYAVMALVTVLFSGCITATILMSNASKKEKEKIIGGEVFEIPNGTITYMDGSTLSFKRYGSYIRFDDYDGDCVIITPSKVYQCDHVYKTYAFDSNKDGKYYYTSLSRVFPTQWYRWDKFAKDLVGSSNKAEGTAVYAGQTCVSFITTDMEIAGYKRIFMYREVGDRVTMEAKDFSSSCNADFDVPEGYKDSGDDIVYSEIK